MGNYIKDLKINRYDLDSAIIRQAQLYYEWAIKAAQASSEADVAKSNIELVKSKIEKKIRKNPDKYGIDNPTESAIKAEINLHPRVRNAQNEYFDISKEAKVLNEARKAFEQRRKMLEALVSLNIQLHFAEPRIPTTQKEIAYKSKKQKLRAGLKTGMSRKIKRRR